MLWNQMKKYFSRSRNNDSTPLLDESPLCETCSALDLCRFFREGVLRSDHPVILGALTTILSNRDTCGLCHLISLVFSRSWRLDLHPDEDLASVQVQLRVEPCGWADSTFSPFERKTSCAHRISLRANTPTAIGRMMRKLRINLGLELQMMEDDAGRFGRERAFHGRRVEAEVSIERIREWMQICEKEHGPTCADVWKNVIEQLPQGLRIIDVVQMAVVEAPWDCRYVALSYMWGEIKLDSSPYSTNSKYETRMENVGERLKRGSLKDVELPRTILDAIKLVQELGERYLWVDALCIVQDDFMHKGTQIAGMNMIYGAAALTIFAAGGDSAHASLPGLEPGSRQNLQHIKKIQSLQLAVPLRTLRETLATLKWNTRGWTFQEHILSRRRLFFTNEQLFFECERDEFCEDVIAESCKKFGTYPGKDLAGCLKLDIRPRPSKIYEDEYFRRYAGEFMKVIEAYSIRQLTNDDDIYNAVFGLITVFSRGFEMSPFDPDKAFLFGMPTSVLEDAMLWQPALDAPAHERRRVNGLVTPSWSWAGWMGGVMYRDHEGLLLQPGSYQSKGSLVDEWVIGDPNGRARRISTVRPLQGPTYLDVPVKYIGPLRRPSAALVEEGDSLAPGTLLFCTTAAFLRVRKINCQVDEFATSQAVRDYGSTFHSIFWILSDTSPPATMGRIVLPTNTDTTEPFEFVVLSRATASMGLSLCDQQVFGKSYVGCLLNVMVIKRVGMKVNGMDVSERFGVGVIVEAAWIATGFNEQVVCLQ